MSCVAFCSDTVGGGGGSAGVAASVASSDHPQKHRLPDDDGSSFTMTLGMLIPRLVQLLVCAGVKHMHRTALFPRFAEKAQLKGLSIVHTVVINFTVEILECEIF